MKNKLIFEFSKEHTDGNASMVNLLGGKGANLAEMSNHGISVPPGFTITTEACNYFMENNELPDTLETEIINAVSKLELYSGLSFDGKSNPLLLSVRSGGRISMPGMMDTILNLGLNDKTVEALKSKTSNGRFAKDSYRRFIQMYSNVVLGIEGHLFEEMIDNYKLTKGVLLDTELDESDWDGLIKNFKELVKLLRIYID